MTPCWRCKKAEGKYWGLCQRCLRIRNQEVAHLEPNTFEASDPMPNMEPMGLVRRVYVPKSK